MGLLNADSSLPNYNLMTPLYEEMRICAEYLHISHSEYEKLSRDEKMKWMFYDEMVRRREKYFDDKNKEKMKQQNKPQYRK